MRTLVEYAELFDANETKRVKASFVLPGLYAAAQKQGKGTVTAKGGIVFVDKNGYELAYVWPDDRVLWAPGGQAVVRAMVGL